jgi:hypothetical protein
VAHVVAIVALVMSWHALCIYDPHKARTRRLTRSLVLVLRQAQQGGRAIAKKGRFGKSCVSTVEPISIGVAGQLGQNSQRKIEKKNSSSDQAL